METSSRNYSTTHKGLFNALLIRVSQMRILSAAFITALLISAVAGTLLVNFGIADPMPAPKNPVPVIHVQTPKENQLYNESSATLAFTVDLSSWGSYAYLLLPIQYYLDGKLNGEIGRSDVSKPFSVILTSLPGGNHSVEVMAITTGTHYMIVGYYDGGGFQPPGYMYRLVDGPMVGTSGKIYFTVDTTPHVSILSTEGKTYDATDVPFNFTVSEDISWLGYSLDGKANVTITDSVIKTQQSGQGNYYTVLTGLSEGSHSLIVYATDATGHTCESQTIHFAITQEKQPQETEPKTNPPPFPTALIATAFVSVVAVSAVLLLFYFWKRNH